MAPRHRITHSSQSTQTSESNFSLRFTPPPLTLLNQLTELIKNTSGIRRRRWLPTVTTAEDSYAYGAPGVSGLRVVLADLLPWRETWVTPDTGAPLCQKR